MDYELNCVTPHDEQNCSTPANQPDLMLAAEQVVERFGKTSRAMATGQRLKVSRFDIPVRLADGAMLLFNGHTRSLILLTGAEAATYGAWAKAPFLGSAAEEGVLLQTLVAAGHILSTNVDEVATVRQSYDNSRNSPYGLSLTIAPTMACNFGCGYCFQGAEKPTSKMSLEVQDAIFNAVKAKQGLKSLNLVWYGGEPLMARETVFRLSDRLISFCDKHKVSYGAGMVSNAYFLNADIAQQLYSRRVRWVQVTIDGDRDTHDKMRPLTSGQGTFDRIFANIGEVLDETPLAINVRVNVGRRNIEKVSELLDSFAASNFPKRGRFGVYFAKIEASTAESGGAFEEMLSRQEFSKGVLGLEAKAISLGMGSIPTPSRGFSGMCVGAFRGGYVITGDGEIHKCWETAHDRDKRIGSILELDKLREDANARLWDSWSPFDNPVCTSCHILPMCGGHCPHRFIYSSPDHLALPCPSWKWNTAEYIFGRAHALGVVRLDQWLPEEATMLAQQSGEAHTRESLRAVQDALRTKTGVNFAAVTNAGCSTCNGCLTPQMSGATV